MSAKNLPDAETLRKLLRYVPETGRLFWRERGREFFKTDRDCNIWNTRYAGTVVGWISADGYRQISIFARKMKSHRVIWAMETGKWPEAQIDHEDHDRLNNRWNNLREATSAENVRNQSRRTDNTSGICGVSWHKQTGKWHAQIMYDGQRRSLGLFPDLSAAAAARADAERELGFHENHGA